MKTAALACLMLILTACASDPAALKLAAELQAKPTLEMKCPAGCELSYTDPRDRAAIRLPTNGYDVANNLISTAGSVFSAAVVPAAFAITASKGFEALKGSGQVTNTTTTTTTTTSTDNHAVDSTHAPTAVTQPSPVVVQIPAGQVVQPVVVQPQPGKICTVDPVTSAVTCS